VVDTDKFGRLLAYFGSPAHPNFLGCVNFNLSFLKIIYSICRRIVELLQQDYFHGYISGKQAEVLLCNKNKGSFLVRFSANRWGQGWFFKLIVSIYLFFLFSFEYFILIF
jgi:hypothetical protein